MNAEDNSRSEFWRALREFGRAVVNLAGAAFTLAAIVVGAVVILQWAL